MSDGGHVLVLRAMNFVPPPSQAHDRWELFERRAASGRR
jgi:hypothetical protein